MGVIVWYQSVFVWLAIAMVLGILVSIGHDYVLKRRRGIADDRAMSEHQLEGLRRALNPPPPPPLRLTSLSVCGDNYPMPKQHAEYRCVLFAGHYGLHEHQQANLIGNPDYPPAVRWWTCSDGEVIPQNRYARPRLENEKWIPSTRA